MISIIIASYNSSTTIEKCLESLRVQAAKAQAEIIVVDSSADHTAQIVKQKFPGVQLYQFSERKFPGDARNIGVQKSRGDILAFIDADCAADPNWLEEIERAHRHNEYPVIGGAIDNANPESWAGWVSYFCEYSAWMPQEQSCFMDEIPSACLTVKRPVFYQCGPFLEKTYCEDTAFHWKLIQEGYHPFFDPAIRVSHSNTTRFKELWPRKIFHGKCFGAVLFKEKRFPLLKRWLYLLTAPALPFLIFSHRAACVLRKKIYRKEFLIYSPLVFLGIAAWSWGQFLGYLSYRDPLRAS